MTKLSVPESAIIDRLEAFEPFRYGRDPRYPWPVPGVTAPLAPPYILDCCTFIEALLVRAWMDVYPDFGWSLARHDQMMILDMDAPFSPIDAVCEAGMGVLLPRAAGSPHSNFEGGGDADIPPPPWTLVQGWRNLAPAKAGSPNIKRKGGGGHTFIVVGHHQETDRILTIECNISYKLNGVGFRGIGNLVDTYGHPPERWWELDGSWTWRRVCATYRYRKQATLHTEGCAWAKL